MHCIRQQYKFSRSCREGAFRLLDCSVCWGVAARPHHNASPPPCNKKLRKNFPEELLGSVFGRTDFSRVFIFGPPDFSADFLAGFFLLIFVGKSAQKNPPGKSPAKSSKNYTTKIPDTFLQRVRLKNYFGSLRHTRLISYAKDSDFSEKSLVSYENFVRSSHLLHETVP